MLYNKYIDEKFLQDIENGNYEEVTKDIENGANVKDPYFFNFAVLNSQIRIAEYILSKMSMVSLKDRNGNLPANVCVRMRQIELLNILIKRGVDLNVRDFRGKNAIRYAVCGDEIDLEIMMACLKGGSDPSLKDRDGNDSLHLFRETADKISYIQRQYIKDCSKCEIEMESAKTIHDLATVNKMRAKMIRIRDKFDGLSSFLYKMAEYNCCPSLN